MMAFAFDPRLRRARPLGAPSTPRAPALLCRWAPAPDGRGLVAQWVADDSPWYPPARRPERRGTRPAVRAASRPARGLHPLLRLAAA